MVAAILAEIELRQNFFGENQQIDTVYFGGGTPSLLSEKQIGSLIDRLQSKFEFAPNPEITLEANPDDLDQNLLRALASTGINRLSIGLQSFSDADLLLLNRSHNAGQSSDAVKRAQDMGFENLTIDLIYGIPGSGMRQWQANVREAIALEVPHISAYSLTVEEKTALHHQVRKSEIILEPDAAHVAQYLELGDLLDAAGVEQYELSNFAKPGFRSRHNSAYWKGLPYLGLGPSAHSYKANQRYSNVANNALYLKNTLLKESNVAHSEELSPNEQLNEYLMTQLRIVEGLDIALMQARWGFDILKKEADVIENAIRNEWMIQTEKHLRLNRKGFMVSDAIISDLFQVAEEE